jgi:hypothetical protein
MDNEFSHSSPSKGMSVNIESKPANTEFWIHPRFSILQALKVLLLGRVKIAEWNGLDYYVFKCKEHGQVVSYLHGYDELLICPECESENMS